MTNPKHRETAEKIWKVPAGTIQEKVGFHAVQQSRMLKDGVLTSTGPRSATTCRPVQRDAGSAARLAQPGQLRDRLDVYPTVSAQAADLILPSAMWVEKEAPSAMPSAARSSGTSW